MGQNIQDHERDAVYAAMDETFGIARTLLKWDSATETFYLSKMPYQLHGYLVEVTVYKPG